MPDRDEASAPDERTRRSLRRGAAPRDDASDAGAAHAHAELDGDDRTIVSRRTPRAAAAPADATDAPADTPPRRRTESVPSDGPDAVPAIYRPRAVPETAGSRAPATGRHPSAGTAVDPVRVAARRRWVRARTLVLVLAIAVLLVALAVVVLALLLTTA